MSGRELNWKVDDYEVIVRIEESAGSGTLHIGDRSIHFEVHEQNTRSGWFDIAGKSYRFYVHRDKNEYSIWLNGRTHRLQRIEKGRSATDQPAGGGSGEVRALMPGKVLRVDVAVGDSVTERQTVIIMESMKMESALYAPKAGKVAEVRCQAGQVVDMGELLIVVGDL